ncbi:MAG: hypothetical protein ACYDEK_05445 [Vulcanimicrobiaceae bacterium]
MEIVLEIHLVVAFLVVLFALALGWVPLGRRVMVAVIGLQVLIGAIVAGMLGASHHALPPAIWPHVAAALLAMFAYILARRIGERSTSHTAPALLGALGLALILVTVWLGWHMAGRV